MNVQVEEAGTHSGGQHVSQKVDHFVRRHTNRILLKRLHFQIICPFSVELCDAFTCVTHIILIIELANVHWTLLSM